MLKHRFCKRLDIDYQTRSGNSIELKKNTIDRKYANDVISLINILCQSMLYKLITIQWRRTPTIYLLSRHDRLCRIASSHVTQHHVTTSRHVTSYHVTRQVTLSHVTIVRQLLNRFVCVHQSSTLSSRGCTSSHNYFHTTLACSLARLEIALLSVSDKGQFKFFFVSQQL